MEFAYLQFCSCSTIKEVLDCIMFIGNNGAHYLVDLIFHLFDIHTLLNTDPNYRFTINARCWSFSIFCVSRY